jgi:hypothetical protein
MDPLHCYVLEFFRLRKFSSRSMVTVIPLAERLSHHEGREGHEDRAEKEESNLKKIFFLRALRVLRGVIDFCFDCGSAALGRTAITPRA